QRGLVNVGGVDVPLGRPGAATPRQGRFHFCLAYRSVRDVRRQVRRGREHAVVRGAGHVMGDRGANVGQRVDGAFGRGPGSAADRRGALRRATPTAFEFVQSRVEFAPLTPRKETPFEGILQPVVV